MLSWTKREGGSASARWNGVWFRITPSQYPLGWTLTGGSGDMELGLSTFIYRDDATEEAQRLALSKELREWNDMPVSH